MDNSSHSSPSQPEASMMAEQALTRLNQELEQRVSERTAELQKSEQRYRALMDGASDAIFLSNLRGYCIEANHQAESLLGYSQSELTNLHLAQIHPPTALAAVQNHFSRISSNGMGGMLETSVLNRDGRQVSVEITASLIDLGGEQVIQAIVRNITERKQTKLALELEVLRRNTIFNTSCDGIHIMDRNGNLIEANERFAQMLGYTSAEIVGFTVFDWDAQWSPVELAEVIKNDSFNETTFETLHRRKNGSIFPVEISRRKMVWQGKSFLVNISRDISKQKALLIERQEYQSQLEHSNAELLRATRLKDEFLANMSHELRTPLNAILGLSESFLEEVFGIINERQKKAISTIESSGEHLLSLINDILEVSKIEAGEMDLELATVSVATLTNSTLAFVKQLAYQKQIQLTTTFPNNLGNIDVDERRMRQVLINLLNNAVKFTPAGGRVTLDVQLEQAKCCLPPNHRDVREQLDSGTWILFAVTDTGIGITAENQSKLFKPFVQIDGSLNRQYQGTGLGLTLVKQIVELHGGSVILSSEFGQGSCFTVRLPYYAAAEQQIIPSPEQTPILSIADGDRSSIDLSPIKYPLILLAEDNQENIDTLSSYLEACKYRLILAKNGHEVISILEDCFNTPADLPDLILMDIQMPGMDGLETMQRIRQYPQLANLPIIALTALAMTGDREKCLAAGANDYLHKPVKLKQLRANIQRLIPTN
jgi:PAS domain S-box-containing protein